MLPGPNLTIRAYMAFQLNETCRGAAVAPNSHTFYDICKAPVDIRDHRDTARAILGTIIVHTAHG